MVPPGGWQNLTWLHSNLGASSPAPTCTPRRMETCPHSKQPEHSHPQHPKGANSPSVPKWMMDQHTCPSTPGSIPQPQKRVKP